MRIARFFSDDTISGKAAMPADVPTEELDEQSLTHVAGGMRAVPCSYRGNHPCTCLP